MKLGIIGLGNPLRGDDAIGIIILDELKKLNINKNIEMIDGGEGGFNIFHYLQGFKRVLIIDAVDFGGNVGETKLFNINDTFFENLQLSTHDINICKIADILRILGKVPEIFIFGIQPKNMNYAEGLSPELNIKKITEEACKIIDTLVNN
jgi:hydrogenase maturation protease